MLWIGLGILALTSLVALSIAYPSAFLIGLLGAGVLGSGGALASSLSLGSLSALGLFSVISAGLLAPAGVLFSLVTFGIYKAENHSRLSSVGTTSEVASATTPAASNAATAVLSAPGSSASPAADADGSGALISSKSPLLPAQTSDSTASPNNPSPRDATHSQGATNSPATPPAP